MARPEWIEVGRVSRAHGVKGELRVLLSSDNPDRFRPGAILHARPAATGAARVASREPVLLTVRSVRGDGSFPIVAFDGVNDRDAAEALQGYLLEVSADELPELEDDEYYPFDLVGLEVRDQDGASCGSVVDVVETPAHFLLAVALAPERSAAPAEGGVSRGAGEVLVPFVSEAVPTVDIAEGHVVVAGRFLFPS